MEPAGDFSGADIVLFIDLVVLTQVCSFCESSLSCKLMIYVLFCMYAILHLKGFQSLSE